MSIKRTREVSRRRPHEIDDSSSKKPQERVYKWDEDVVPRLSGPQVAYAATHRYAKESLVLHKAFGVGLVTRVDGARLEILFKDGAKKLAHNPAGAPPPAVETGAPPAAEAVAAPEVPVPAAPAPEKTAE